MDSTSPVQFHLLCCAITSCSILVKSQLISSLRVMPHTCVCIQHNYFCDMSVLVSVLGLHPPSLMSTKNIPLVCGFNDGGEERLTGRPKIDRCSNWVEMWRLQRP